MITHHTTLLPSLLVLHAGHHQDDALTLYLLKKEKKAVQYILTAAKLLAPALNPVS